MVQMTRHAKERLEERFGIVGNTYYKRIQKKLNRENEYELVRAKEEIREFEFNGRKLQAVVIDGVIVTILGEWEKKNPNAYIKQAYRGTLNNALKELHETKINVVELEGILAALRLNKWNDSVKALSKLRKNNTTFFE